MGLASPHLGVASPLLGGAASPHLGAASPLLGAASPLLGAASPQLGAASPLLGVASPLMGWRACSWEQRACSCSRRFRRAAARQSLITPRPAPRSDLGEALLRRVRDDAVAQRHVRDRHPHREDLRSDQQVVAADAVAVLLGPRREPDPRLAVVAGRVPGVVEEVEARRGVQRLAPQVDRRVRRLDRDVPHDPDEEHAGRRFAERRGPARVFDPGTVRLRGEASAQHRPLVP